MAGHRGPKPAAVLLWWACAALAARGQVLSVGCTNASRGPGRAGWHTVEVEDFEPVERRFWLRLPPGGIGSGPAPLLLAFHGQTGNADKYASKHDFARYGSKEHLIVAYPQGMDDGGQGTGWNTGAAGDASTCLPMGVDSDCYRSCQAQGRCGPCNWSTCYDDRLFVQAILRHLFAELCVDTSRVYLLGESNGGMLVHYLVEEMPGAFAAVVSFFGLPLLGYAEGNNAQLLRDPASLRQTAILQAHGRQDRMIPPGGGVSNQGWIYESQYRVQRLWSALHGCSVNATPVETDLWDGGSSRVSCTEFDGCTSRRRVMTCGYDGNHSDWPHHRAGEQLAVWFMLQFRRDIADQGSAAFSEPPKFVPQGLAAAPTIALAQPLFIAIVTGSLLIGGGCGIGFSAFCCGRKLLLNDDSSESNGMYSDEADDSPLHR